MIRIINDKTGQVKFVSEAVAKSGYLKSYGYRIEDLNINHSKIVETLNIPKVEKELSGEIDFTETSGIDFYNEPEKKKLGRPKKTDN